MLVWGGVTGYYGTDTILVTGTSLRYDPARDAWSEVSSVGRPIGTASPVAVWTGSRFLVFSLPNPYEFPVDGGSGRFASYDPVSDRWDSLAPPDLFDEPCSFFPVPNPFVWTGEAVVLFGYRSTRYEPGRSAWVPLARRGHPVRACISQTAVWTGTQLIVWGPVPEASGIWTPGSP